MSFTRKMSPKRRQKTIRHCELAGHECSEVRYLCQEYVVARKQLVQFPVFQLLLVVDHLALTYFRTFHSLEEWAKSVGSLHESLQMLPFLPIL